MDSLRCEVSTSEGRVPVLASHGSSGRPLKRSRHDDANLAGRGGSLGGAKSGITARREDKGWAGCDLSRRPRGRRGPRLETSSPTKKVAAELDPSRRPGAGQAEARAVQLQREEEEEEEKKRAGLGGSARLTGQKCREAQVPGVLHLRCPSGDWLWFIFPKHV